MKFPVQAKAAAALAIFAEDFHVSVKTVQEYCARIKEKLRLANATELLREAVRWHDAKSSGQGLTLYVVIVPND
ncbi:MAG: hypothetical protein KGJ88_09515 [Verrucomicrobiota bacterium]|nr:hypothetical protein [Verrucomicrobiota bacterium]